jgi:hypothetical protein
VSPTSGDVHLVWGEYQKLHPQAKLSAERKRLIASRLRLYPADMLIAAIHGNHADPYCNGENPTGTTYHDLGLIIRNADKIEKYAALATNGHRPNRSDEEIEESIRRIEAQREGVS